MHTFYAAHTYTNETVPIPLPDNPTDPFDTFHKLIFLYFCICKHYILQNILSTRLHVFVQG